jgi:hypothetical protein
LVRVPLAAAGAYPAVAAFGLEYPRITLLAIEDKTTIFIAIAVYRLLNLFNLIICWFVGF